MAPKKAVTAKAKEGKEGKGKPASKDGGKEAKGKSAANKQVAITIQAPPKEDGLAGEVSLAETSLAERSLRRHAFTPTSKPKSLSPRPKSKDKKKNEEPKTYLVFRGCRPDEELLEAVSSEIKVGDAASVEWIYELLRGGEDVNQRSELGATPLAVAAAGGNGPLVSLLLERNADVKLLTTHKSEIAMHHAARAGNRVVCQLLAEPTRAAGMIDHPNVTGWPPLHIAALAGHESALSVLLRHGADINARNAFVGGGTALHMAVRSSSVGVAEVLLDRDAQVDACDVTGRGALHFAAARLDSPCVSLLLRSRADAMRQGFDGKTPLNCVPLDESPTREKVVTLLQAYMRPNPVEWRHDARFDRRDERDVEL